MNRKFDKFEGSNYNAARSIIKTLHDNGHKAFLVGGCVRDALLGIKPGEYDITTSALPGEVRKLFKRNVPIGESFGVILILIDEMQFEVATFRQERDYTDGRHPGNVNYTVSEIEDVVRRDFTINGMLYDPIAEELYDHVNGEEDLKKGLIRTIGNAVERFSEDKLRMIRAVRFTSRFGFKMDGDTFNSISDNCSLIGSVSNERIRDEIVKIITQNNPGDGLKLLNETGLLKEILPDVHTMIGIEQPPQFHPEGDVFIHTCLVLDKLYKNTRGKYSLELAMGALLHDVGKPPTFEVSDRIRFNGHDRVGAGMAKGICRNLKFSKKQIERIVSLIREHLKFKDVRNMRQSTLKRFLATPYIEEHLEMHLADCQASHGITEIYEYLKDRLENLEDDEIKPPPLVSGIDLIGLGFKPGPLFKIILDKIEEQQLEGDVLNKEDALDFISKNFSH